MKKLNTEIFIERSKNKHKNEYDYSLVDYINSYTKVKIICKTHGVFEQLPSSHMIGQRCLKCVNDEQTSSTENFIKNAKIIHGNKYNYSLVDYKLNNINVKIICPEHGMFEQKPYNHLSNNGCPICRYKNRRNDDYIQKCNKKFNNMFDYSLVQYTNNKIKVKIICPEHGIFEQTMKDHYNGNGCPYCSGKKMNTEIFIKKCNKIHNNVYDYSLVDYIGAFKKVKIICKKHGIFEQMSYTHLSNHGCPVCKSSKGEKTIMKILNENNIKYIHQKKFNDCKNTNVLFFDFYIPDKNLCIEYNGLQHYKPIDFFGGIESYEINKKRFNIKKD